MIDDIQFLADKTLHNGLFNVVAGMDGFKELVEESLKIPFVERFGSSCILNVRLRLFQGAVDGLTVVETFGKSCNFGAYEYVGATDRLPQLYSFQRRTSAECYVRLSSGKHSSGEVDNYPAERQPLTFMNSDGPCQSYGILGESS